MAWRRFAFNDDYDEVENMKMKKPTCFNGENDEVERIKMNVTASLAWRSFGPKLRAFLDQSTVLSTMLG